MHRVGGRAAEQRPMPATGMLVDARCEGRRTAASGHERALGVYQPCEDVAQVRHGLVPGHAVLGAARWSAFKAALAGGC